ncbi:hypothetical protein PTTG_05887 [Puccinia triticina 1-1 BBBD Race 1]|uniref:Uncharacterized protein n=2 Tax=Puccinia triticina TaxID=208348 RepID=A0A180GYG7_PUCT1|nr:uncharacterized protein PtA15_17A147 [Puccinia triticina]OAV97302.1 hypothetical protein PTTG_05887 [Puccinia triticina 1-1 BBBD Race 1]WAQ92665.1 hypothetical protein PtA15_17A147 [Puccinia triticina]WAR63560.1 hypothetical protein PtB15_17B160 [Puccinia triticina]
MPGIGLPEGITPDGQGSLGTEELDYLTSSLALAAADPVGLESSRPPQTNPVLKESTTSDDLIPAGDPCHHNLKLRNLSVQLLQRVTARTILGFVLSLLEGEDLAPFRNNQPSDLSSSTYSLTRESIIKSVQKNRDSFARQSRSEAQLIIGNCLLITRAKILDDFENDLTESNDDNRNAADELEAKEKGDARKLERRLNEESVSRIVEEQLKELITNQFTEYSHQFLNPDDDHSAFSRSISLVEASNLISFSGQVFYWNRFFDLLFLSPNPL